MPLSATPPPTSPRPLWGAYRPEKKQYDDWTSEHFQSRNWHAFVIGSRGWRSPDVLAVRGNNVAVIEVKSPYEKATSLSWQGDYRNLSSALEAHHGAYLRGVRKRIFELFPKLPFVRFYAIVMASQLYRYYIEFEELASRYERFTHSIKVTGLHFSKLPFLVVPAEYERELKTATEALAANGFVVSPSFETTPRLAMSSFSYP